MSIPTPKFVQGEEVAAVFRYGLSIERVEIINLKYLDNNLIDFSGKVGRHTGWVYSLADKPDIFALESRLRKLPPDPSLSIESLMTIDNPIPEEIEQ